jgi:hypothetical protein
MYQADLNNTEVSFFISRIKFYRFDIDAFLFFCGNNHFNEDNYIKIRSI